MNYSYNRETYLKPSTIVNKLIIANLTVFLFQKASGWLAGTNLVPIFGLVPGLVFNKLMLWQLVSYMFLHGDIFHIFFNMFGLWIFGRELEFIWGPKEFLKYYFITGIGAGLLTWITGFNSMAATIGASGAVMGVLLAYALYFPNRYLYIYGLFPVKAKYLAVFYALISLFMGFGFKSGNIAHFAHLGGMIVGFCYLKCNWKIFSLKSVMKVILSHRKSKLYRINKKREKELRDLKTQVDEILDKININGMESLTKKEKKILEKASNFLKKNQ